MTTPEVCDPLHPSLAQKRQANIDCPYGTNWQFRKLGSLFHAA